MADDVDGQLSAVMVFDDFTGGCFLAAAAALADRGLLVLAVDVLLTTGGQTPVDGVAVALNWR